MLKAPKGITLLLLSIGSITIVSALYFFARPKDFVQAKSVSGGPEIICKCMGRVFTDDKGKNHCKGLVMACYKNYPNN